MERAGVRGRGEIVARGAPKALALDCEHGENVTLRRESLEHAPLALPLRFGERQIEKAVRPVVDEAPRDEAPFPRVVRGHLEQIRGTLARAGGQRDGRV